MPENDNTPQPTPVQGPSEIRGSGGLVMQAAQVYMEAGVGTGGFVTAGVTLAKHMKGGGGQPPSSSGPGGPKGQDPK
ncbi:MAG: hypothetical protein ACLQMH_00870 [Solirubrobacteraceae bacterium]